MLKIRLSRTGKKKQASYRVVVAHKESPRDGRVVERIGHYNPLPDPAEYRIAEDRALYWLSKGAQPTDAVRILLEKQGTFGRLTRLHAGEEFDSLIAEFTGAPVVAEEVEAVVEEEVIEEIEEIEEAEEEAELIEEIEAVVEEAEAIEEVEEAVAEAELVEEVEEAVAEAELVEEVEEAKEEAELVEEIEEAEEEAELAEEIEEEEAEAIEETEEESE